LLWLPFRVEEQFPNISIPLRENDPDVRLGLSGVFRRTYQAGPYRKVLRYDAPPDPPLAPRVWEWARNLVSPGRTG